MFGFCRIVVGKQRNQIIKRNSHHQIRRKIFPMAKHFVEHVLLFHVPIFLVVVQFFTFSTNSFALFFSLSLSRQWISSSISFSLSYSFSNHLGKFSCSSSFIDSDNNSNNRSIGIPCRCNTSIDI